MSKVNSRRTSSRLANTKPNPVIRKSPRISERAVVQASKSKVVLNKAKKTGKTVVNVKKKGGAAGKRAKSSRSGTGAVVPKQKDKSEKRTATGSSKGKDAIASRKRKAPTRGLRRSARIANKSA